MVHRMDHMRPLTVWIVWSSGHPSHIVIFKKHVQ
jgi:hypothetical protein